MEVVVRPWAEDDAPAMERAVAESREHLRPWMAWAAAPSPGIAWRRDWIREQHEAEAAGGDRLRGAFLADGTLVGAGGLHARLGPGALEIGYWVHVSWTRRGVATAVVGALSAEAFSDPGIERVEIHHDVANAASGAVARSAGYTLVGDRARAPVAPADTERERVWRLTRDQYRKRI
ncbi:MAG TPA: GNAT family protein [Baekduia sp.]|nr:GNAT family protein [Baekduia sp.]